MRLTLKLKFRIDSLNTAFQVYFPENRMELAWSFSQVTDSFGSKKSLRFLKYKSSNKSVRNSVHKEHLSIDFHRKNLKLWLSF